MGDRGEDAKANLAGVRLGAGFVPIGGFALLIMVK